MAHLQANKNEDGSGNNSTCQPKTDSIKKNQECIILKGIATRLNGMAFPDFNELNKLVENFDYKLVEKKSEEIDEFNDDEEVLCGDDEILKNNHNNNILTGIKFIDYNNNTLNRGECGIILTPVGGGKTTALSVIANNAVNQGKNVLQIIFEDKISDIKRKHYAMWSKISLSEFEYRKEEIRESLKEVNKNKGHLIIKKFDNEDTTIPDIKNWIIRYQKKCGYNFDLLVIDYLDCISSHKKNVADANEGELAVIKALITMAEDLNISIWTAMQGNRNTYTSEIAKLSLQQEKYKTLEKIPIIVSFSKPDEMKFANASLIKTKYSKKPINIENLIINGDLVRIESLGNDWKNEIKNNVENYVDSNEHTFTNYLGSNFQEKLIWQLLVDSEFAEKILFLISSSYFDNPNLIKLYILMLEYFNEYNQSPSLRNDTILLTITRYKSKYPIEEEILNECINKIKDYNDRVFVGQFKNDGEIIQKKAWEFIRQQELRKVGENIIDAVKTGDIRDKNTFNSIVEKMNDIEKI